MSYNIPRNVKGEGRILSIFSYKAVLYTGVGIGIGYIFHLLFSALMLEMVGYIIMGVLGFIGFGIATFKMPDSPFLKSAKLAAGEQIDEVIKRAIKFKMNKNKYYVYAQATSKETKENEGGNKDGK